MDVGTSTTVEPGSMAELISDCAELPDAVVRPSVLFAYELVAMPSWRPPAHQWRIDDACLAQVSGLDDY